MRGYNVKFVNFFIYSYILQKNILTKAEEAEHRLQKVYKTII